jgi:hypothetical protein
MINYTKQLLLICGLILPASFLFGQEICDNGIDDDGDGLVDLNDDECICETFMPSSLIPNPSFEEMSCCPMTEAQLTCADDWIQASTPTTDYMHTCGITAHPFLGFQAPLPFPDGEGAIGFRDGKPGVENFKEYTGACLNSTMEVGVDYRLDFFVGFHDAPGSGTLNMAVFGSTECNNLPFGGGDQNFGCPTNGPGWVLLGEMTYSGTNEWVNAIFEFTADQPYEAIVLGPTCDVNPDFLLDPYFFFDRLVIAETSEFGIPISDISGNICQDNLTLTSSDKMVGNYQWYMDGVAIVGETNQSITISNGPDVEGEYNVILMTDEGCFTGDSYTLVVPSYSSMQEASICDGEIIIVGDQEISEAGTFEVLLQAADGCDSLVTLTVSLEDDIILPIEESICTGSSIEINGVVYDTAGIYEQTLTSDETCDTLLMITIQEIEVSTTNLNATLCEGETIEFEGMIISDPGEYEATLSSSADCDSIIVLLVEGIETSTGVVSESICEGSTVEINGEIFNDSGSFTQSFEGSNGCDSILTINISLLDNSSATIQEIICPGDSVIYNGISYFDAGTFMQLLTASNGCDSTLNIIIEEESSCNFCEDFLGPELSLNLSILKLEEWDYEVSVDMDGLSAEPFLLDKLSTYKFISLMAEEKASSNLQGTMSKLTAYENIQKTILTLLDNKAFNRDSDKTYFEKDMIETIDNLRKGTRYAFNYRIK